MGTVAGGMSEVTQSGAKKARKDTVKVTNKKKDPAALAKLEEGDQAMKDGNFALAKQCFDEATELAKNSTVEKVQKIKAPKQPKAKAEEKAAESAAAAEEPENECVL